MTQLVAERSRGHGMDVLPGGDVEWLCGSSWKCGSDGIQPQERAWPRVILPRRCQYNGTHVVLIIKLQAETAKQRRLELSPCF